MDEVYIMTMKGNLTVEAAIIVPILLFSMVVAIQMGMYLLEEIKNEPGNQALNELWAVHDFYQNQIMEEIMEND